MFFEKQMNGEQDSETELKCSGGEKIIFLPCPAFQVSEFKETEFFGSGFWKKLAYSESYQDVAAEKAERERMDENVYSVRA